MLPKPCAKSVGFYKKFSIGVFPPPRQGSLCRFAPAKQPPSRRSGWKFACGPALRLPGKETSSTQKRRLPHGRRRSFCLGSDQFDDRHFSSVTAAGTDLVDAGVAAGAVSILGAVLINDLLGNILLGDVGEDLAFRVQILLLTKGDHLLGHGTNFLGAGNGGLDLTILKQVGHHRAQHGVAAVGGTTEFSGTGHSVSLLIVGIRVSRGVSFRRPWSERNQGCPA